VVVTRDTSADDVEGFVQQIPLSEDWDRMTKISIEDLDFARGIYFFTL
jgi:hypothetical protein